MTLRRFAGLALAAAAIAAAGPAFAIMPVQNVQTPPPPSDSQTSAPETQPTDQGASATEAQAKPTKSDDGNGGAARKGSVSASKATAGLTAGKPTPSTTAAGAAKTSCLNCKPN